GRAQFFAAAAEAMRRILVDGARRKATLRRGGRRHRLVLLDGDAVAAPADYELLDLDDALAELASADPRPAGLVPLRVFAGVTVEEAAAYLKVSPRTAKRTWAYARAWLGRRLGGDT